MAQHTTHNIYAFRKVAEKEGITLFYSHPSKSDHNKNPAEFISEMDGTLKTLHGKRWKWIIDAEGFDLKHALGIESGMELAKLLTDKYGESLVEIKFINPTWNLRSLINLIWPFLTSSLKLKIHLLGDKAHSILEYI
jgi:hypothetical protein